jgi:hypothetical protein
MTYTFLIIGQALENRVKLSHAILKRFPGSHVLHGEHFVSMRSAVARIAIDAVILYASANDTGVLQEIRELRNKGPVVIVGSSSAREAAIVAGGSSFLPYDAVSMLGSVVSDVLSKGSVAA